MDNPMRGVTVFAPMLYLTVTIEASSEGDDEVHIHPGGQGFWIARMLNRLGETPVLCSPLGGETGVVISTLIEGYGVVLRATTSEAASPIYVTDRRRGDRLVIAESPAPRLGRHEVDDLYGSFVSSAIETRTAVVTGQNGEIVPGATYRRLGADLSATGVTVVGDLHGAWLTEFLEGGPIDVLKVSDEDLVSDGTLRRDAEDAEVIEVATALVDRGARRVVVSRAGRPALVVSAQEVLEVTVPVLEPADHRGSGDSQTAGLAAALRRGLGVAEMLRLACAAGSANVTRHGLGSATDDLVASIAGQVRIRQTGVGVR